MRAILSSIRSTHTKRLGNMHLTFRWQVSMVLSFDLVVARFFNFIQFEIVVYIFSSFSLFLFGRIHIFFVG